MQEVHCSLKITIRNKNINIKFYIQVMITPAEIDNPSYPYTNTTTAKQQHSYPPAKHSRFTKIRSEREGILSLL